MTSNIKKRPDYVRLGFAITSILVVLVLVFSCFNGLGLNLPKLVDAMGGDPVDGLGLVSLSLLDLMKGFTIGGGYIGGGDTPSNLDIGGGGGVYGPFVVNGLRAALVLLLVAIVIAGAIIYGVLSKKFSYKTLKILTIANVVLMIAVGTLILCTKCLVAKEVMNVYSGTDFEEQLSTINCKTLGDFVMQYFKLQWGAITAASCALVAAVANIGLLIYAKVNKLEL